ncbi:hypothetical protein BpHYR1_012122, partial [Brachionus plicatilis]
MAESCSDGEQCHFRTKLVGFWSTRCRLMGGSGVCVSLDGIMNTSESFGNENLTLRLLFDELSSVISTDKKALHWLLPAPFSIRTAYSSSSFLPLSQINKLTLPVCSSTSKVYLSGCFSICTSELFLYHLT